MNKMLRAPNNNKTGNKTNQKATNMYCWRVCLQVVLFILIIFWAGLCAKLSMDALARKQHELRELAEDDSERLADYDAEFNNSNSTRMMRFIHRSVKRAIAQHRQQRHLNLKQRLEIARDLVHLVAEASQAERNGEVSLVDSAMSPSVNPQEVIKAKELVAADNFNLEHNIKN